MTSRSYFGKMNSTLGSVVPLAMFDMNPGTEHVVDQLWEVQEPSAQPQHHHRHRHHNIHFATADGRYNIKNIFKLDYNSTYMLRASLGQKYNDQNWELGKFDVLFQLPGSYLIFVKFLHYCII